MAVDPDIVGVVAEIDAPFACQIFRPQQPHRSIAGVRDIDGIARRLVADALRLLQPGERASHPAYRKIDNTETVIPQLGDEKLLPLQIDCEMVDAAADRPERNLSFELQRRSGERKGGKK